MWLKLTLVKVTMALPSLFTMLPFREANQWPGSVRIPILAPQPLSNKERNLESPRKQKYDRMLPTRRITHKATGVRNLPR